MKVAAIRRWSLIALAAGAFMTAAGFWLLSGEAALEWLVAEAVRRSHGALSVDGVQGSLFGPITVRRLAYESKELRLTLEDATVDASPRELARGQLAVRSLEVRVLRLEVKPSTQPAHAPESLALPLPVSIARASIHAANLQGHALREVSFGYEGGAQEHALHALKADSDFGRIDIDFRMAAHSPFALSGSATLARTGTPDDWSARATVSGSLVRTIVDAAAAARAACARATARIAAFEPRWLDNLELHLEDVDLAAFDRRLPETRLAIDITGAGTASGLPEGHIQITNQRPGTLTAGRVPLVAMTADYALSDRQIDLSKLNASLGAAGALAGSAHVTDRGGRADLKVTAIDLRALHAPLRATRLNGTVRAELTGADQHLQAKLSERGISFAVDAARRGDTIAIKQFHASAGTGALRGSGVMSLARPKRFKASAALTHLDASKYGDYPKTNINGELKLDGTLEPDWRADVSLVLGASLFRSVRLSGNATGELSARGTRNVKLALTAGANTLRANGNFGRAGDALEFALEARQLAVLDSRMRGALNANGRLAGTMEQPGIDVEVTSSVLGWQDSMQFKALRARLGGTAAHHVVTLQARSGPFDFAGRVDGQWEASRGWTGALVSFENKGLYPVTLAAPMPVRFGRAQLTAGPAEARVAGGRVSLVALSWQDGRLDTRGELSNLPVAPFFALAGVSALSTDLRVGGRWSLATTSHLNGTVTLVREAGDIVRPGDTPIPFHLERLRLEARVVDDAVDGTLDVAGSSINGHVKLAVASLARNAPLRLDGKFDVDSLKLLAPLVGTRAVVDGRATLALAAGGTLDAPRLTGNLVATGLRVESPRYGVRLRDGTLRAELGDAALRLREFTIRAGEGRLSATGAMSRTPKAETKLEWRAEDVQVFDRPDMRLNVNGAGTVGIEGEKLLLRGALAAKQGYFEFNRAGPPKLGTDVVVVGRPRAIEPAAARTRFETKRLDLDVLLDLGDRVHIVGSGIDTNLGGKLQLRTTNHGSIEARGTLVSSRGVYYAFGQRLEIEKGRLIFDGPLDNPALDILAKRKNLQVEAGVEVTGTARVPRVQLVSQPPVAESEKLAWLTLGRPLRELTAADVALLQVAAGALMSGRESIPVTRQIANRLGLDDLALRGSGAPGSQVMALGKRFSDKLYVEYQQGLAATSAMLRLSYVLTRAISVRVETGTSSTFGIYFNRSYE